MATEKQRNITKRAGSIKGRRGSAPTSKSIKPTSITKDQLIKKSEEAMKGGVHPHWIEHKDPRFTEMGGWHEHIFLIAGSLVKTEWGGVHRHAIGEDGSVGPQMKPHEHDLFINETLVITEEGGKHSHARQTERDDNGPCCGDEDWIPPEGSSHRHFIKVDGVTYQSLTADDVLSVGIRKELKIGVQSILLDKERFLTFEDAANKAEALGFNLKKTEERNSNFVFTQMDSAEFVELSLQTITLEDGVQAVIGVMNIDKEDNQTPDLEPSTLSADSQPAKVDAAEEEQAFDEMQTQLTAGYFVLSEKEASQLSGLKEKFAAQVLAVYETVDKSIGSITHFLNDKIEKSGENFQAAELMDRITTQMVLLQEELGRIEFPEDIKVEIDDEILKELTNQTHEGVCFALETISNLIEPIEELFNETSFENLHKLLKSSRLSFSRFVGEAPVVKALVPTDEMTRMELRESQEERSKEFGIEIVEGSALAFPKDFPTELAKYGDPVNLKFPIDTEERAKNARVRFKQFASQIYASADSLQKVHSRIIAAELEFGVKVALDMNDPLDLLVSEQFEGKDDVTVIEASGEQEVAKQWFVPLHKQSGEERIVFGIVLEPDVVDLHGDTYDEEAVKGAAHKFMEDFQNIKLQHQEFVNGQVKILESFIAPTDMEIDAGTEKVLIKKNTWLMKVRIVDDVIWNQVKSGELTGFSIGALAQVEDLAS